MDNKPLTYNDIYETIREYHWMIRELDRLKRQFGKETDESCQLLIGTSQKRKKWERMKSFERRIAFIDAQNVVTKEQEKVLLDNLLDGVKIKDIAAHLRIDRKTVERIRDRIILRLYESQE